MKQPRKHLLCLLLALWLTGVLLAGCAADTADANADLPVITVGCDNYPPFTYVNSDGKPVGIDVELADEAFRRMGYRPEFVTINWAEKNALLENGVIDCIWSSFSMSGRADEYTWAGPYMYSHQVVAVMPDSDIQTLADLAGKTVVAEAGSAGETAISEDAGLSQAEYISKSVQTDCLMEVAAGTADAAVLDLTLATAMIGEGTDYANLAIKDELNAEEYGAAFRKGSDAAEAVNAAFDELKADGTMQALADKYSLTLAD